MAPIKVTEDYYGILEVLQTDSLEVIKKSYKRLALKCHPDRNLGRKEEADAAFKRLVQAWDTLKDSSLRAAYDRIYVTINVRQSAGTARHSTASATGCNPGASTASFSSAQPDVEKAETIRLTDLRRSLQDQETRYASTKASSEKTIANTHAKITKLKQEITNLDAISAAEKREDDARNSWSTWLLSPIYKERELTLEEKDHKERGRQERFVEKNLKNRRLVEEEGVLCRQRLQLQSAEAMHLAVVRRTQDEIDQIMHRRKARVQEQERVEKERQARILRERQAEQERIWREKQVEQERIRREKQVERDRVAREKFEQAERAEQARRAEQMKRAEQTRQAEQVRRAEQQSRMNACAHGGWWPKVEGRRECPTCHQSWSYLLRCPGCSRFACPKCQSSLRPRGGGLGRPGIHGRGSRSQYTSGYGQPHIETEYYDYDPWD